MGPLATRRRAPSSGSGGTRRRCPGDLGRSPAVVLSLGEPADVLDCAGFVEPIAVLDLEAPIKLSRAETEDPPGLEL